MPPAVRDDPMNPAAADVQLGSGEAGITTTTRAQPDTGPEAAATDTPAARAPTSDDTPADSAAPQQDVGPAVTEPAELALVLDTAPHDTAPGCNSAVDDPVTRSPGAPTEAQRRNTATARPTSEANIDISAANGAP